MKVWPAWTWTGAFAVCCLASSFEVKSTGPTFFPSVGAAAGTRLRVLVDAFGAEVVGGATAGSRVSPAEEDVAPAGVDCTLTTEDCGALGGVVCAVLLVA